MVLRKFTQTFDLNTEIGAPTLLGIHTPIGGDMWNFLAPFFMAYKKYKYVGCDLTIVNAAKLPVDPEQIGKVEGENFVDPRDTLNPMMFKGCHGESLGTVLNSMYGGLISDIFKDTSMDKETLNAALENFYYTALGDDAWRKAPIQKTLSIRGLHPLVYNLAYTHQLAPTDNLAPGAYADNSYPEYTERTNTIPPTKLGAPNPNYDALVDATSNIRDVHNDTVLAKSIGNFLTNKCQRLGWMDTLQVVGNRNVEYEASSDHIAELPKLFMGLLMLPPAYLCRQYLRIVITHKIKFAGYRTITTGGNVFTNVKTNVYGYGNKITGNVPNAGTTSVRDLVDRSLGATLGASEDVEEAEEDEDDA